MLEKIVKIHRIKRTIFFLFYMYKMLKIKKETWGKNGVEVIFFNDKKSLNEKHIEKQLEHSNLPAVTLQYSPELKKKEKN